MPVGGKRRTLYAKTEREARKKLCELQRQAATSGGIPTPGRRTVADLLDFWLQTAGPTFKPRSLELYAATSERHIRPTLGKTKLSQLAPDHLQKLYSDLQRRGLRRVPEEVHKILHRALRVGVLMGWLGANPADRVIRPSYRAEPKELWTPVELSVFLAGARGHWLYNYWLLALSTGCRSAEMIALRWEDVDLVGGTVNIRRSLHRLRGRWAETAPKTRAGERAIKIPSEAVAALRRQKAQQNEWRLRAGSEWNESPLVFTGKTGRPLHHAVVHRALRSECRRLGIRELSVHALRHAHASLLLAEGLPVPAVSRRLGHADSSVTLRVYAHCIKGQDDVAAQAIAQALQG